MLLEGCVGSCVGCRGKIERRRPNRSVTKPCLGPARQRGWFGDAVLDSWPLQPAGDGRCYVSGSPSIHPQVVSTRRAVLAAVRPVQRKPGPGELRIPLGRNGTNENTRQKLKCYRNLGGTGVLSEWEAGQQPREGNPRARPWGQGQSRGGTICRP